MKAKRSQTAKQRQLAAQLGEVGFALPGSLTVKAYRCGKQNCRCHSDPPRLHGPYAFWTRKIDGKTVTRMLSDEQLADYQPLFDNARKIRDLVSQLNELSLELVEPPELKPKLKRSTQTDGTSPGRPRTPKTAKRQGPRTS